MISLWWDMIRGGMDMDVDVIWTPLNTWVPGYLGIDTDTDMEREMEREYQVVPWNMIPHPLPTSHCLSLETTYVPRTNVLIYSRDSGSISLVVMLFNLISSLLSHLHWRWDGMPNLGYLDP